MDLYEYGNFGSYPTDCPYGRTASAANNGSGFEGLGDNTWFWNYSCGIVLILGRFVPIVGQVAIAGILAKKKYIPESAGTLKTDTVTFGVMTFAVIFIVAALSFFPVHALSTTAAIPPISTLHTTSPVRPM